jgi:hypothetical protein
MRRNRRIHLPHGLRPWIPVHLPAIGDLANIQFRSCKRIPFWWLPGNRNMAGLTLWNRVYLRAEYCPIDPRDRATVELVLHELVHVAQFRRNPVVFPIRYLVDHLRYGYHNNPAEIEARQTASRLARLYFSPDEEAKNI